MGRELTQWRSGARGAQARSGCTGCPIRRGRGAVVVAGARGIRVERAAAGWRVTTANASVEARDVLLATNGYTNGAAPALQRRFVPIGSYIIATEPLGADRATALLPRRRMAFDSKHMLYYFRVTGDERLLFGGRAEFSRPDRDTTRRAAAILRDGMIAVFPELADVEVEYGWRGNVD